MSEDEKAAMPLYGRDWPIFHVAPTQAEYAAAVIQGLALAAPMFNAIPGIQRLETATETASSPFDLPSQSRLAEYFRKQKAVW